MTAYQLHWTSTDARGHRAEGWTPITYTEQEAAAVIKARQQAEPDSTFEKIPVETKEG